VKHSLEVLAAARQEQFLAAIDPQEAARRFQKHLNLAPLGRERIPLAEALGRVLAVAVSAPVDVPAFDRANVDGFAVQSRDTFGAGDVPSVRLRLNDEVLTPGKEPGLALASGTATAIATGGMLPRGADAVVMIEHTELIEERGRLFVEIRKPVVAGQFVAFAGSDIAKGETVLRPGVRFTSRELGVLAAVGLKEVEVFRRPKVAILSTGDEIVPPGMPLERGKTYDSNGIILAAAVRELGGDPVEFGVLPDQEGVLWETLQQALRYDLVLLSGGTSKGAGDLSHRCLARLENPGVIVHGVALKPGKPICLAVTGGKPVVALPGFPTSAIFTFHTFVAPVLRRFAGLAPEPLTTIDATLPLRVYSERGRLEYLLVSLIPSPEGFAAYPLTKGSGAVTAFSFADGFIAVEPMTEMVSAGSPVKVRPLSRQLTPADLVFIGSQCLGLDVLLSRIQEEGYAVKTLYVGSQGGVAAARRGECDLAGVHLVDPGTGEYNRHLLTPELCLVPGYRRLQGVVFRLDDPRFAGKSLEEAVATALADPSCILVNRNPGSGTRLLIDRLLGGRQPTGYAVQPKSHHAVAASVAQGRADWGVTIDVVAHRYGLGFLPLQEEYYDFLLPIARAERPAVRRFCELLQDPELVDRLAALGFRRS
jgi:putative molybdopterin biosynthesis protein